MSETSNQSAGTAVSADREAAAALALLTPSALERAGRLAARVAARRGGCGDAGDLVTAALLALARDGGTAAVAALVEWHPAAVAALARLMHNGASEAARSDRRRAARERSAAGYPMAEKADRRRARTAATAAAGTVAAVRDGGPGPLHRGDRAGSTLVYLVDPAAVVALARAGRVAEAAALAVALVVTARAAGTRVEAGPAREAALRSDEWTVWASDARRGLAREMAEAIRPAGHHASGDVPETAGRATDVNVAIGTALFTDRVARGIFGRALARETAALAADTAAVLTDDGRAAGRTALAEAAAAAVSIGDAGWRARAAALAAAARTAEAEAEAADTADTAAAAALAAGPHHVAGHACPAARGHKRAGCARCAALARVAEASGGRARAVALARETADTAVSLARPGGRRTFPALILAVATADTADSCTRVDTAALLALLALPARTAAGAPSAAARRVRAVIREAGRVALAEAEAARPAPESANTRDLRAAAALADFVVERALARTATRERAEAAALVTARRAAAVATAEAAGRPPMTRDLWRRRAVAAAGCVPALAWHDAETAAVRAVAAALFGAVSGGPAVAPTV